MADSNQSKMYSSLLPTPRDSASAVAAGADDPAAPAIDPTTGKPMTPESANSAGTPSSATGSALWSALQNSVGMTPEDMAAWQKKKQADDAAAALKTGAPKQPTTFSLPAIPLK